eukprot:CAMPEP_0202965422 /NCGR_PEP_ID=MMETSP1396-20130829/9404_1 /ASSEMBLY_ACC=CAM_ASM_000872 /TAXON_ID= /ORGANISM="Pseudokeronopsis sp., Strain Brazil" /LENGTH=51 /DNA_ID=CAMNT_0049688131 /DNA_START=844 /DNA_END=999 /DNA_ORIENTATION=-
MFGGNEQAFNVEKKVEVFVLQILEFAFRGTGLTVDAEVQYEVFDELIKPDL